MEMFETFILKPGGFADTNCTRTAALKIRKKSLRCHLFSFKIVGYRVNPVGQTL